MFLKVLFIHVFNMNSIIKCIRKETKKVSFIYYDSVSAAHLQKLKMYFFFVIYLPDQLKISKQVVNNSKNHKSMF